MRIKVTKTTVSIIKNDYTINNGEYNVNACNFVFDEEYDGLVKKAIFKQGDNEVEMAIIHDGCDLPSEFLNGEEMELKVYGYELQGDKYVIRYSPTPTYIYLRPGSYRPSEEEITPTQFEQYEQALNNGLAEVDHVDVDATKSGKTATISVTNRHNETKTASIKDGANFEYNWSGTSLGVKTDEEEEYDYVNLKGEPGEQGPKPVKGVDYFTAQDIASMEDYIINDSTSAFNQNATQKTNEFNTNATNKTTAFNNNASSKTGDFDTNASNKTTIFNNNASSKTGDFNTNATNKTNSFNSNATDKTTAYNNNHTDKVGAYDSNATSKTTDFNDNASAKTTAFNENASEKTTEFNENAEAIQEELDYYKTLENALSKVTGTGESITLNDTANSPLSLELEPTKLSQDSEPSPSSPQDIHVISGDNTIKVENKNLLDVSNYELIALTSSKTRVGYLFNLKAGTYTLSNLDFGSSGQDRLYVNTKYDGESVFTERGSSTTLSNISMTNDGQLALTVSLSQLPTSLLVKGMLEKGSTSTTYVKRQEQIAQLNLGGIEYCKIGNYKDRFFKNIPTDEDYDATRELGKWYLKKNIDKNVLDGSEVWISHQFGTNSYQTTISNTLSGGDYLTIISNYFRGIKYTDRSSFNNAIYNDTQSTVLTIIRNTQFATVNDFTAWLSTHNTPVYYVLATPTYTLLNNTLQSQLETIYNKLLGYQEQTNISQVNNDLPFNINAKAIYDLNKLVERVTELENE